MGVGVGWGLGRGLGRVRCRWEGTGAGASVRMTVGASETREGERILKSGWVARVVELLCGLSRVGSTVGSVGSTHSRESGGERELRMREALWGPTD